MEIEIEYEIGSGKVAMEFNMFHKFIVFEYGKDLTSLFFPCEAWKVSQYAFRMLFWEGDKKK